jgi:hypothetical protein
LMSRRKMMPEGKSSAEKSASGSLHFKGWSVLSIFVFLSSIGNSPLSYWCVWKQMGYWCWSVCGFCRSWHLHMSGTLPYTSLPKMMRNILECHVVLGDSASTHLEWFHKKQTSLCYVAWIIQTNDTLK